MCRVLEVSSSGYYEWRKDIRSQRKSEDERLIDLIRVLHAESFSSYGVRRIVRGLKHQGILVNGLDP
jgi:putative transposase